MIARAALTLALVLTFAAPSAGGNLVYDANGNLVYEADATPQAQGLTDAERALLLYLYRSQQAPLPNAGLEAGRGVLQGLQDAQEQQERDAERARRLFPPRPPRYDCRHDGLGGFRCDPR